MTTDNGTRGDYVEDNFRRILEMLRPRHHRVPSTGVVGSIRFVSDVSLANSDFQKPKFYFTNYQVP